MLKRVNHSVLNKRIAQQCANCCCGNLTPAPFFGVGVFLRSFSRPQKGCFHSMELSQTQPQARVQVKRPALAMLGIVFAAFVGMFSETSLNIALPSLMASLNVSQGTAQWLITGYMLVIGICMPLSGLLARHLPTKRLLLIAIGTFIIGAVIAGLAGSFPLVLAGRMLQGVGTGIVTPLMFSVALQVFPPHKLGAVMGMAALVIMFATAIGPTLTGLILARYSWHMIFWLFVPILAVAFVVVSLNLETVFEQVASPIDWVAILLSTIGFGGIVVGVSFATDYGWLSVRVLLALVVGAAALASFARRQLTSHYPILNLQVFQNRAFTTGTALVMLDFAIILGSMYLLPLFMQQGMHLPVATVGMVMLPGGIVNALVSAIAGRSFDRYGAKWLTRIGFTIAIIGVVILLNITPTSSITHLIIGHVTLMVGAPLAMAPAQTYALSGLDGQLSADGSAILNTLQQIVGACATAIATSMLALGRTRLAGVAGETAGVHAGFWFVLVLAVVALGIALTIRKPRRQ